MSHYFIHDESLKKDIKKIEYTFAGKDFVFTTDSGLFSRGHIDPATEILLKSLPPLSGNLLDLGCGYGCVGIILAKIYPLSLTQADINQSAVDFTRENCVANGVESFVVKSDCFDEISGNFNAIVLNPPIHAGKMVTYKMYEQSINHLFLGGKLFVVTLKKHGAESTKSKLESIFGKCETLYKKKGYYVFCCEKGEK